jgi:NAD(P)-dependent dehydrogenase (short-subunit alcohol dehydrogenase family)
MTDYTPESFQEILDVNTPGTFLNVQAIAKYVICRQL